MKLVRSALTFEQSPVPVDWPRRVGPPPGVVRMVAYPASGPPDPEHPKTGVDAVYPARAAKLAKAHAWMFPSKRIKVGKRVMREAVGLDLLGHLEKVHSKYGPGHPITVRALRAVTPEIELMSPSDQRRVRKVLSSVVSHQVRNDAWRGKRWQQTASVDVDKHKLLGEALLRLRFGR